MAFQKGFSLVQVLAFIAYQRSIFKLIYKRFPKISKGFHTYFIKNTNAIFLSIKVFQDFHECFYLLVTVASLLLILNSYSIMLSLRDTLIPDFASISLILVASYT